MTIDEMASTLFSQAISLKDQLEAVEERCKLVARIKHNIEMTKKSDSSSLNRRWADLEGSQDPVKKRLYAMSGYIGRPLIGKMMDRTMNAREYDLVLNGTDRQITEYVVEIYRQRTLDPLLSGQQRYLEVRDYEFVANLLKPTFREKIARILKVA